MEKRSLIHGFYVDLLNIEEVTSKFLSAIKAGEVIHCVTINPEIIQAAKKRPRLAKAIKRAEVVTPDGVGVILALKMKGIKQTQVTGVDLSKKMLALCAENNIKVGLIGAKPEVLTLVEEKIKNEYPNINIAYTHDGYFGDFAPIMDEVINSGAQFILCAMGSPKQEFFISVLKKYIKRGAVMIGVGGTFDVLSGTVQEAPQIFKKVGLEWLYRTVKQPERFKRIFPALPIFFFQSIIDSMFPKKIG